RAGGPVSAAARAPVSWLVAVYGGRLPDDAALDRDVAYDREAGGHRAEAGEEQERGVATQERVELDHASPFRLAYSSNGRVGGGTPIPFGIGNPSVAGRVNPR